MNHSQTEGPPARNVRANAFLAQMHRTDRAAIAAAIEQQNVAELERAAIAARIKQARKEAGLSQPEMADALGVIARTYQNYESLKDPRTPWALMNQIATVTGKTTEWLIHGDRATPDLLDAARADQLDGVSTTFSVRVDNVEAQLSQIAGDLADFRTWAAGAVERMLEYRTESYARLLERLDQLSTRQGEIAADVEAISGPERQRAAVRRLGEFAARDADEDQPARTETQERRPNSGEGQAGSDAR